MSTNQAKYWRDDNGTLYRHSPGTLEMWDSAGNGWVAQNQAVWEFFQVNVWNGEVESIEAEALPAEAQPTS